MYNHFRGDRMNRVILHSDINHCYAQIEEMKNPQLREVPMAVGGFEEKRHGIILAKNDLAKTYQIKTGESLREAKAKCPQLLIVPPNYQDYMYYTEQVKNIYRTYSDRVESYGLDEAWIDVSESVTLFGDGRSIAQRIQQEVWETLGLTVSIGISFNKIFAKLGSDQQKHLGLVEITQQNYQEVVWPLPVDELFYVGRATAKKLHDASIHTIGQLAKLPIAWMKCQFGKVGELIWGFANGLDQTIVNESFQEAPIKSIGNGITTPKNIETLEDAIIVYYVLVESVAARAKEAGLRGKVISLSLRNTNLSSITRQRTLSQGTNLCEDIMDVVVSLLKEHYDFSIPLRTISISLSQLEQQQEPQQLNLFVDETQYEKQCALEETMERIKDRYGYHKARRCSMKLNPALTSFDPKREHIIHPDSFF